MKTRPGLVSLAAIMLSLLLPTMAAAEGTACGFETVIVPDGRFLESTIPAGTTFWFLADLTSGRSYSVEVRSRIDQFGVTPGTVTVFGAPNTCPPTALTATSTVAIDPQFPNTGTRVSFTAATTRHRVSVNNASGSPVPYTLTISETTQFSASWSTNGTFNTFYSFLNTTNATCNGSLTLLDTTGAVVTTTSGPIPPGGTFSTNTASLGTTRNKVGTAQATHDCPPGAILIEAAIANFSISPTPYIQIVKFEPVRQGR